MRRPILFAALLLTSCNGLFGGIYDEFDAAGEPSPSGCFVARDADGKGGTIYVDVRSYTQWVFLDFHSFRSDTVSTADSVGSAEPPFAWDLALHRWDVKTHDGMAAVAMCTTVEEAAADAVWDAATFSADVDSAVVVDMSTMAQGYLGTTPSKVNPVLSEWLDVDLGEMPPIYTLAQRVYLLRLADGSRAALQFTNYMDDASRKGFVTIRYRYPL